MFAGVTELMAAAHGLVFATEDPDGSIITNETVSPGGIGFLLFALLGLGTFLLWLSMNKQLKRIDFDEKPGDVEPGDNDASVDVTDSSLVRDANETPEG